MDKYNVVNAYNGILFGNKKEWSTDKYYNMDKSWKHYAKGKKPNARGLTLYDAFIGNVQNRQIWWR